MEASRRSVGGRLLFDLHKYAADVILTKIDTMTSCPPIFRMRLPREVSLLLLCCQRKRKLSLPAVAQSLCQSTVSLLLYPENWIGDESSPNLAARCGPCTEAWL